MFALEIVVAPTRKQAYSNDQSLSPPALFNSNNKAIDPYHESAHNLS